MFTGLVSGQGKILSLQTKQEQLRLCIELLFAVKDLKSGESVAVNGVCLTAEEVGSSSFMAYASRQSLSVTNLNRLTVGSLVNIEFALALTERLGGHIVTGHVDTEVSLKSVQIQGESKIYTFNLPQEFEKYIVKKGSVTLDGISLTVVGIDNNSFKVNIIPKTYENTIIKLWKIGSLVNLEVDILAKYIEKLLINYKSVVPTGLEPVQKAKELTLDFLKEQGY